MNLRERQTVTTQNEARTDAVALLAARLENTRQVLSAWARATGSGGELLRKRLDRAAHELDQAVGALTVADDEFTRLDDLTTACDVAFAGTRAGSTDVVTDSQSGGFGLRGHSEMISLVEFIAFLSSLGKNGVLQAQASGEDYILEIRDGYLVYGNVEPTESGHTLGEILVEQGAISCDDLERGSSAAYPDEFLGEALTRLGLLDHDALIAGLTRQAVLIFYCMHRVGTGFKFQFEENTRIIEEPDIRLGVSHLLLESARILDEESFRNSAESETAVATAESDAVVDLFRSRIAANLASGDLDVPVLPDATGQLLALCWSDQFDANELMACVNRDQALSAHLLRIANSAAYAPAAPISSIQIAISRIGLDKLREVAMALTLKQQVFQLPGWEDVIKSLWRTAALTSGFGGAVGKSCGAGAMRGSMVGLLLDIGKPIVLNSLYQIEGELDVELTPAIADVLMEEFHGPIGELLAEQWSLPDWLSGVVQHHHDYSQSSEFKVEAMVGNLACELALWADAMDEIEAEKIPSLPVVGDLGLGPRQVQEILTNAARILELANVYS